jgi:hypothetical protein
VSYCLNTVVATVTLGVSQWSGVTCAGGGCPGRPDGGPPSAQRHFDRCSPIEGPVDREVARRGQEEITQGGDGGGGVTPRSISPSPEDADLVGTSVPRFLTTQLAARQSLSLSSRARAAPLEACHPEASMGGSASRDSP